MANMEPSADLLGNSDEDCQPKALLEGPPLPLQFGEFSGISQYLLVAAQAAGKGIHFVHEDGAESLVTYEELLLRARVRAFGFLDAGIRPKEPVVLQCLENREFVICFWALILIGAVPVPLAFAPWTRDAGSDLVQRLERVWLSLEKPAIVYDQLPKLSEGGEAASIVAHEARILECLALDRAGGMLELPEICRVMPQDVAMIQYSSGSTGSPKGVTLTHQNLISNVTAISLGIALGSNDSAVSWMPYHHDMGLIGFHLVIVANQMTLVNLSPMRFIRSPQTWLDAITRHKVTVSGGPNFGYQLVTQRLTDEQIAKFDLSSLKVLLNGAEPISAQVVRTFVERMKPAGLRDTAMFPVYGMAEASLAVTFPRYGLEAKIVPVARQKLAAGESIANLAPPATEDEAVQLVSVGSPVSGCRLRVVDEGGKLLDEGLVGRIQIRGESVTSGYWGGGQSNDDLFEDGWLNTGDLGLVLNRELYVTGRQKDVIFVNGCNYYSFDLEQAVEGVGGLTLQQVAVAAAFEESVGRDIVVMFATGKPVRGRGGQEVLRKLWRRVAERTGIALDYLTIVKRIPKTTSGKIQRQRLMREFLDGEHRENCHTGAELVAPVGSEPLSSSTASGDLEGTLRECWSVALGCSPHQIGLDDPFRSLGGNSVKAVQLLGAVERRTGLSLSHDMLLKCATLREMHSYVGRVIDDGRRNAEPAEGAAVASTSFAASDEDIAIIGVGTRLPSGESPMDLWETLARGRILTDSPKSRRGFASALRSGGPVTAGYLSHPYDFDPGFFGLDDAEAQSMDPQQRVILEVAWDLLDRAGYSKTRSDGHRVGFYLGASHANYAEFSIYEVARQQLGAFATIRGLGEGQRTQFEREWTRAFGAAKVGPHTAVNNLLNMIAARVSHTLNLKGPSLVVDTACSSSLVATHLACESLRRGECEMALCGGVNLLLTPTPFRLFAEAGVLAPSGKCKVFDESAEGMVPGEGAVLFLMKRLSEALRDGDRILAVVRGSAVNNDGESLSVMAPNPDQQRWVIESVYRKSGLDPRTVGYVEAHGTGTRIGDPSEVRALSVAFGQFTSDKGFCAIGSAKANLGHLLSAAGALGLAKAVLMLGAREIPPCAALERDNPLIQFEQTPFYAPKTGKAWEGDAPRRVAVNSFGFGGTNCHMLLEEAPSPATPASAEDRFGEGSMLRISAHSESALQARCIGLADWLERFPSLSARDLSFSMNARCASLEFRRTIAFSGREDLIERLRARHTSTSTRPRGNGRVALLFTGQGSQYPGMAQALYRTLPLFREHFDAAAGCLNPALPDSLQALVFGPGASAERLSETLVTQAAIFCVDYALGKLLLELGLRPTCMLGHSVGEYAAACLAGVMSLRDCTAALAARASGMQRLPGNGGMCAALANRDRVAELISGLESDLGIAAHNGTHLVVSGLRVALDEFQQRAEKTGIVTRRLQVSHAFHSPLMAPMTSEFRTVLERIEFRRPEIPVVSNVTGLLMEQAPDAEYWIRHVLAAVNFEKSILSTADLDVTTFIEAGPDTVLANLVKGIIGPDAAVGIASVLRRKAKDCDALSNALSVLDEGGIDLDFRALEVGSHRTMVELPPYPFQRRTYSPMVDSAGPNDLIHRWSWKEAPKVERQPLASGAILCLTERQSDVLALRRKLDSTRHRVIGVAPWDGPYGGEWASYRLDVTDFDALRTLMTQIEREHGSRPVAVVNCLNCTAPELGTASATDDWTRHLERRVLGVLAVGCGVAQELSNGNPCRHVVVTSGAARVDDDDQANPFASAALAASMALSQEKRRLVHACLDFNDTALEISEVVASQIVDALQWQEVEHPVLAWRTGKYLLRQLEQCDADVDAVLDLGPSDTILITGGCGGVGAELALDLARRYRPRLVLTGTQPLSAEAGGKHQAKTQSTRSRRQLIEELERLGAVALYFPVDVTNVEAMSTLVQEVNSRLGPITGVIHAAGKVDETPPFLSQKSAGSAMDVIGVKALGALVLDQVTAGQPLAFFALFSSIAASDDKWSRGLWDYAAANGFLDGFAAQRAKSNRPGRAIAFNWSLWDSCGMGRIEGLDALVRAHGATPLGVDVALSCFRTCVAASNSDSVVHVVDLTNHGKIPDLSVKADAQRVDESSTHRGKSNGASSTSRTIWTSSSGNISSRVHDAIADVLVRSRDAIDMNLGFRELGFDSNQALALAGRLGAELGERLSPALLFEYQSPKALLDYLERRFGGTAQPEKADSSVSVEAEGDREGVAIIGMACRFPGANDLQGYWDILCSGTTQIREVDDREFLSEYFSSDESEVHGSYCKWSAAIDGAMQFDAGFFGISPREAESMDPQQRKFLEVAYEAVQQAGYAAKHPRNVGVFVGCEVNHYSERFVNFQRFEVLRRRLMREPWFARLTPEERRNALEILVATLKPSRPESDVVAGAGLNEIAARVSHFLDLSGPSCAVNAACSSSLVALHMACSSIRRGESSMAIVGGAYLNLGTTPFVFLSRLKALSPSGRCSPFDASADGLVLGEGVAAIVLKSEAQALADGDPIWAVIRGSAINNDGHSQGITVPSPAGQAAAIVEAYRTAQIDPRTISYVECHGTGTALGDPIEIEGLNRAFGVFTQDKQFCAIGSAKAVVGHMLAASGMAGVIKVALSLRNGRIPGSAHLLTPNPHIDFAKTPFYVSGPGDAHWRTGESKRRAGVNAFGFGGTNVHVILEEASERTQSVESPGAWPIVLSAKTETAARALASSMHRCLQARSQEQLVGLGKSISRWQGNHRFRWGGSFESVGDLVDALANAASGDWTKVLPRTPSIVLVLGDATGAEQTILGELRARWDCCESVCCEMEELVGADAMKHQPIVALCCWIALGRLLQHLGLEPACVVGEPIGAAAGLVLTGKLELVDLLKHARGAASTKRPGSLSQVAWRCGVRSPCAIGGDPSIDWSRIGSALPSADSGNALSNASSRVAVKLGALSEPLTAWTEGAGPWVRELSLVGSSHSAISEILDGIVMLWKLGLPIDVARAYPKSATTVLLPAYPFEKKHYEALPVSVDGYVEESGLAPSPAEAADEGPIPERTFGKPPQRSSDLQLTESQRREAAGKLARYFDEFGSLQLEL